MRELSMLSHDKWGGMTILKTLLDAGADVYLEEYNLPVEASDPYNYVKLSGPCMGMMLMRDAEDRKRAQENQN